MFLLLTSIDKWDQISKAKLLYYAMRFIILLLISISIGCKGQNDKAMSWSSIPELKQIVSEIEKWNRVESPFIGHASMSSIQWKKFEQLMKIATEEQLIGLTDHKNSVVRCYAFQALAARNSSKVFKVLLNHLRDTPHVETQRNDLVANYFVGDYLIEAVTPNLFPTDIYKLNYRERKTLDSILLFDKSVLVKSKSSVILNLTPTPEKYERIRELLQIERNEYALIPLAKYKKPSDRELIASFFKIDSTQTFALCASIEFPDDYFYPFIKGIFEQEWKEELYDYPKWRFCFQALAKYPRKETIDLFKKTTKLKHTRQNFRYNYLNSHLLIAITKFPDKLFEPLKDKIKLDEVYMDEVKRELDRKN